MLFLLTKLRKIISTKKYIFKYLLLKFERLAFVKEGKASEKPRSAQKK
jgi:hypothetical protein